MNIPINKKLRTPEILAALFDLDGTLLDANEEIPNNILNKIILISKIIPVSIISGRIFSSVLEYAKLLQLTSPQISDNGAIIFDPLQNNKIIFSKSLDKNISRSVFEILDKNNFEYFASADGKTMTHKMKNKNTQSVNIITCFYKDVKKYLNEKTIIDKSKTSLIHSSGSMGEEYISFMPKNIHKGIAVDEYSRILKIDKSKIFAIGDGMNDIEMLKESGVSVAMGNSVQEVFKVSKYSTKKYIENGTQEVLDWILKGINP